MRPIWRVSTTFSAYYAATGAAWPYLPIYYRQFGLTFEKIGAVAAFAAAVQLLGAPAVGRAYGRVPGQPTDAAGCRADRPRCPGVRAAPGMRLFLFGTGRGSTDWSRPTVKTAVTRPGGASG